jgi:hypothetical protein
LLQPLRVLVAVSPLHLALLRLGSSRCWGLPERLPPTPALPVAGQHSPSVFLLPLSPLLSWLPVRLLMRLLLRL